MQVYLSAFQSLLSGKIIIRALVIFFLYLLISILLPNNRLLLYLFETPSSLSFKLTILKDLLVGSWTSISHVSFFLMLITALLFGTTLSLFIQYRKRGIRQLPLALSGTSGAFLATGCASCGVSLLSFFLPISVVTFLPFHGMEIQLLGILLLGVSLWRMIRNFLSVGEDKRLTDK